MEAQKRKKNVRGNFWCFLKLIKIYNFLDSFLPYERLLENPKIEGSRELFVVENDFKTCSTVNSTKWLKN